MWTDYFISDSFHNSYIQVVQAIVTTIISISVAVFTLSSSFLVSKVENIKELTKEIEEGGISMSTQKKKRDITSFISRMKHVTINSLIALFISIIGFLIYVVFTFIHLPFWELSALLPLIISTIYIGVSLKNLIEWYLKFHKHHLSSPEKC